MAGLPDLVHGSPGDSVIELHKLCHADGVCTVAVSVPPSWHDNPSEFQAVDLEQARMHSKKHADASTVAMVKWKLNECLKQLAANCSENGAARKQHSGRCSLYVDTASILPCKPRHREWWLTADWTHFSSRGSQQLGRGIAKEVVPLLQGKPPDRAATASVELPDHDDQACEEQTPGLSNGIGLLPPLLESVECQHRATDDQADPAAYQCFEVLYNKVLIRSAPSMEAVPPLGILKKGRRIHVLSTRAIDAQGLEWVQLTRESMRELCPAISERQGVSAFVLVDASSFGIGLLLRGPICESQERKEALEAAVKTALLRPMLGRAWRVVGGKSTGGIVVRTEKEIGTLRSRILEQRLETGCELEELQSINDLGGNPRLHYRLHSGEGPQVGWVSIRSKGKILVEPLSCSVSQLQTSRGEMPG
eukprot:gnl/TRDRNA2_/TRDRNA2_147818_c1_seq1.p1 gnl/TRDRNA2_/TRDRNA2_147818_c1~~gnl/TRDRNA2_/TRDRNA2_147818_c1_seq1.p1  ORF type:complete len:421 (+),score=59.14 gnl/TRDRNA2_/TRDRNA2_147818_c1_seq1:41-1303(+)